MTRLARALIISPLVERRRRALVLVCLGGLVALLIAGCGGGAKPAVDPATVIDDAVPAMQGLKSFHFVYEVQKPQDAKPVQGLEIARITGDVTADGKMKASIDLLQNGIPLQANFVAAGDVHYIQDPTTQKWQSLPAAISPVGKLDLSTGAIQVLKKIDKLEYVGTEDVGGTKTYHLKGQVPPAEVAAIAGGSNATKPYAGDVWIGVDDHLVRRIRIVGAAGSGEDPETVRVIDISAFDQPVTIEAPK
jgi:hypothetical protein